MEKMVLTEKDAIAPKIRINSETYHWELSTDGGINWLDFDIVARGQDGITPLVQINTNTFRWEVSSDGANMDRHRSCSFR